MNARTALPVAASLCMSTSASAWAQSLKERVVGAYTLQAGMEIYADRKKNDIWSKVSLVLAPMGQMSLILVGKERASTSASIRTPVGPALAYFGTYTVDEAASVINIKVDSGVRPAFDGTARALKISVTGDVLTTASAETKAPEGMMTPVNEWKMAK